MAHRHTARLVRANLPKWQGVANLYQMTPPHEGHEYVIVSAVNQHVTETYLFAASPDGEVVEWCEMNGSLKGTTDHAEALAAAGYEVEA